MHELDRKKLLEGSLPWPRWEVGSGSRAERLNECAYQGVFIDANYEEG